MSWKNFLSLILMMTLMSCVPEATVGTSLFGEKSVGTINPDPAGPTVKPVDPAQVERFQKLRLLIGTANFGRCSQCHNAISNNGAENFTGYSKEQDWVEAFLVTPGEPENSALYVSLIGAGVDANSETMPLEGSIGAPLNEEELAIVSDWITNIDPETFTPDPNTSQRCGTVDAGGAPARTQAVVQIFSQNCTGCHQAGGDSPDLTGLTDQQLYDAGAYNIGNYKSSKVYRSLRGVTDAVGGSQNMPRGGGTLSPAQITAVKDWICQSPYQP